MTEPRGARRGGTPRPLIAAPERLNELREGSREWPSWTLTPRQICDLELLMCGGFAPLDGFMNRAAFDSVCETMRLPSGALWPIPITLDVTPEAAAGLEAGSRLVLRDLEGLMLAVLTVDDIWEHDRRKEAELVYGTLDQAHPGVAHLYQRTNTVSVGGRIEGVQTPRHYDFPGLRKTPQQLRRRFAQLGWKTAIAFQTRNPMHRAHFELTLRAARELEANLLIHPVVGMTKPGDLDHYTRVRCYRRVLSHYPRHTAELALLPLAMRMAGPREALWHALIRRNYGCTHLIVGRDHAGPGQDSQGKPFYGPYDAQELMVEHEAELGVRMVPFRMMVYVEDRDSYEPVDSVKEGERTLSISGSDLRRRLRRGLPIPDWFTFPEVARELRRSHPARSSQGFTVFFTG
ncbi:MAG: sulfate adenylyltransferase, partial [Holophagales bacterium]|nr:sulfate adenylyltransferase [Holophagales bacterium]